MEPSDLLDVIRLVARGEALLSPGATKSLIARCLAVPDLLSALAREPDALTDRESQVLGLVAVGLSNNEAAVFVVHPA
ncbi:hypothetical protein ABZ519_36395 [Streptomyces collinus]|uniref:hypothetical protein n=1 Tax=Streptomyces collinus TaxID=42684 RepID=UPI0033D151F6